MLICNKLKMGGGGKGPWKVKVLLALLTWTVLSTLFINLDSPLHYPYYHLDSAWYFICGKAWADGLVPYVDFTDSKGPLLWWIYGIGSMISPRDYVGVWILSCFYYTAVLYLCFLISMLLTKGDKKWSFIASSLVIIPCLCWLDADIHAEHWCILSLAYLLYVMVKIVVLDDGFKFGNAAFVMCGVAVGAALFIKWSVGCAYGLMLVAIPLVCGVGYGSKRFHRVCRIMLMELSGVVCVAALFSLWALYRGCFHEMIYEYFRATFHTIDGDNSGWLQWWITESKQMLFKSKCFALVFVCCSLPVMKGLGWKTYVPFVAGMILVGFFNLHDMRYYQIAVVPYSVFFFVVLVQMAQFYYGKLSSKAAIVLSGIIMCFVAYSGVQNNRGNIFLTKSPDYESIVKIEREISRFKNPTILAYRTRYSGIGIASEIKPASLYWALQAGASQRMVSHQDSVMSHRIADVISITRYSKYHKDDYILHNKVVKAGYVKVGTYNDALSDAVDVYVRGK